MHLLVNELCEYQNARCNYRNLWQLGLLFLLICSIQLPMSLRIQSREAEAILSPKIIVH